MYNKSRGDFMVYKILTIVVYVFSFIFSFLGLSSIQFEKFCNVKKPVQVQILLFALSMGLAYLIGNFIMTFVM